ncbi:helix-turn-helix domain-containing protein, partial [Microbacteriaceae bacterium K1510]|nr:helix-turn-helix domain-containing protein [Microbacteriaceae bacterium K1510]
MINKEQLRAARAWLDLSQQDLAVAAKVGKRTIADFERGATVPHDRTLRDIEATLVSLGIEFQFEGSKGVGVRVRLNLGK